MKWYVYAILISGLLVSHTAKSQQVIRVDIQTYTKTYINSTNEILVYGVLPGENPFNQMLIVIDALTGAIKRQIEIEGFVEALAVSPLTNQVYIGLNVENGDNDTEVVVYNLPDYQETARILVGPTTFSSGRLRSIACSPTSPGVFAASFSDRNGNSSEVKLYQDGGDSTGESAQGFISVDQLAFREDGRALYVAGNSSSTSLVIIRIDQNDSLIPSTQSWRWPGSTLRLKEYAGNLYTQVGAVFDFDNTETYPVAHHSLRPGLDGEIKQQNFRDILIDRTNDRLVFLRLKNGELESYTYDPQALHLLAQTRSQLEDQLPASLFDNPILPLGDGLAFSAHTFDQLFLIRQCEVSLPAPTFDPPLPDETVLCKNSFFSEESFQILPPTGAAAIYTEDGVRWDTLDLTEEGYHRLRTIDAAGCLSEFTAPLKLVHDFNPPAPRIREPANFLEYPTSLLLCDGGSIPLVAEYEEGVRLQWSNGCTGARTSVTEPGIISVQAISNAGCITPSIDTVTIIRLAEPPPEPPEITAPNDNIDFCGLRELTLNVAEGFMNYQWVTSNDRSSSQSSFTLFDSWVPFDLQVRVQADNGCWSDYREVAVKDSPASATATILLQNENLLSIENPGQDHEWFYEGQAIPNSNTTFWRASQAGIYQVRTKLTACWGPLSAPLFIEP